MLPCGSTLAHVAVLPVYKAKNDMLHFTAGRTLKCAKCNFYQLLVIMKMLISIGDGQRPSLLTGRKCLETMPVQRTLSDLDETNNDDEG